MMAQMIIYFCFEVCKKIVIYLIRVKGEAISCFGEMLWWAARTSNPVDAAKRSGSIPPPERFFNFIYDRTLI